MKYSLVEPMSRVYSLNVFRYFSGKGNRGMEIRKADTVRSLSIVKNIRNSGP